MLIPVVSLIDGVLDQQDKLGLTRPEIEIMCGNLLEGRHGPDGNDASGLLTGHGHPSACPGRGSARDGRGPE